MNTISTHVLDTSIGKPAKDMPIRLEKQSGTNWTILSQSTTNADGRVTNLLGDQSKLEPGIYRMHFNVGEYFKAKNLNSFYPFAEIVFEIKGSGEHYHVPLLVSPYGYSTYRGS